MVLNGDDWFIIWLGLEINMLSFILIIMNKGAIEVESCLKYFFIQRLGSGVLIIRFYRHILNIDFINRLVLSYKVGGGPFYFWFPSLCEGIRWDSCFFLITIQKIIPFILISLFLSKILWGLIFVRLLVGCVGCFNQRKLKRLMAYSSIHHIGWIIICLIIEVSLWIRYLVIYTFMIYGLLKIFKKNNILTIRIIRKIYEKYIFVFGLLSVGGIPPILGFFLKWWVFYNIRVLVFYPYAIIIISSLVIIYAYIRIIYVLLVGPRIIASIFIFSINNKYKLQDSLYILGLFIGSLFIIISLMYFNKI